MAPCHTKSSLSVTPLGLRGAGETIDMLMRAIGERSAPASMPDAAQKTVCSVSSVCARVR